MPHRSGRGTLCVPRGPRRTSSCRRRRLGRSAAAARAFAPSGLPRVTLHQQFHPDSRPIENNSTTLCGESSSYHADDVIDVARREPWVYRQREDLARGARCLGQNTCGDMRVTVEAFIVVHKPRVVDAGFDAVLGETTCELVARETGF